MERLKSSINGKLKGNAAEYNLCLPHVGVLTTRSEYDRLGRMHLRDVFNGIAQRPSPRRWYDYRNKMVREEWDDNPFILYRWH